MGAVYEREIKTYFRGIMGYLCIAVILLFAGIYTMVIHLYSRYTNFEYVLSNMSFLYLLIIPLLTMRLIAEERKQKTDQLLYSLPLSMTDIVLGKYFAAITVLAIPIGIIGIYPVILSFYGDIYMPIAYGNLLAFYLLGIALLAVGIFFSSLTENQLIAAILCFLALLLNYFISDLSDYLSGTGIASFVGITVIIILLCILVQFMTKNSLLSIGLALLLEVTLLLGLFFFPEAVAGLLPNILKNSSIFNRFYQFVYGIFDWNAVVFDISVTVFFLFLTVQSMEKRRWC